MSTLLSLTPVAHQYLVQNAKTEIIRPSANYHPSIWGDQFLKYVPHDMMKRLVRAYFIEAKRFNEECIPTFEEYMGIALTTGAYSMLTVTSFLGMRDIGTKEALDWAIDDPNLVMASSVICRLMDDIVSHKMAQERGHVCSSVECYMKQQGVTEEEACDEFNRRVEKAWKDINQGCIKRTVIPMPFLMRPVNLAHMIDVIYKHKDGYTKASKILKEYITLLFH